MREWHPLVRGSPTSSRQHLPTPAKRRQTEQVPCNLAPQGTCWKMPPGVSLSLLITNAPLIRARVQVQRSFSTTDQMCKRLMSCRKWPPGPQQRLCLKPVLVGPQPAKHPATPHGQCCLVGNRCPACSTVLTQLIYDLQMPLGGCQVYQRP